MDEPMVLAEQFSFRYRPEEPVRLESIDFAVQPGEMIAIIGPSGGGKSTLSLAINGIIPHEFEHSQIAGRMVVAGCDTKAFRPTQLVVHVGTVLQDPEWQLTRPTVEDEIAFGLENLGTPPAEIGARLDEVLELLGIAHLRHRAPEELSGGQKQRVAIAAALAMKPSILLLDEPISELDPVGKESLIAAVSDVRRRDGTTVLFIDHNLELVVPHADRVLVVAGGRLLSDTTPQALFADRALLSQVGFEPPQVTQAARLAFPDVNPQEIPLTAEGVASWIGDAISAPFERDPVAPVAWTPPPPALTLTDVSFQYGAGSEPAVQNVSLTVGSGEFVSLIGANGAGKSTLARLMAGLLTPSQGEVRVGGENLAALTRLALVRKVGYVFQNPDFQFFNPTVFREIAFGLELQGLSAQEIESRVHSVAEPLGVAKYLTEHPHFLSRGERRRVAIAAVLAMRPEVIILDEPTTGLDEATARRMAELVLELKARGHAIVLLSHEMRLVAEASDRVIVVRGGGIALRGAPSSVFAHVTELREAGVVLPPLMELGRRLEHLGAPITMEPAVMAEWMAGAADRHGAMGRR